MTAEISTLEKAISDYEKHEKDADRFIALIDKYENFDELTITMDKLNDHFADCQTMQTEEHFKYGLSMGVLLMKEIYELSDFK